MNTEAFTTAYNASRNGANYFIKHALARGFVFSDGVRDCAETGCYWLLDIAATELPAVMRRTKESLLCLNVKVKGHAVVLEATGSGDVHLWAKKIPHTDMPEGDWMFYIGDDNDGTLKMILPTEY